MNPATPLLVVIEAAEYFHDHHVEGRAVLPAVEALQALAQTCREHHPELKVAYSRDARFDRFIRVEAEEPEIRALADLSEVTADSLTATLITRKKVGKTSITRTMEHVTVTFGGPQRPPCLPRNVAGAAHGEGMAISSTDLYTHLVPFGSAYQNAREPIVLNFEGATARVTCPGLQANDGPLGSPFPLDAALHVACAWGQRYRDLVAFPVGYDQRQVLRPTVKGGRYLCTVIPAEEEPLKFDIWIHDAAGELHEALQGVRMEDISRGRMKAPAWVRYRQEAEQ